MLRASSRLVTVTQAHLRPTTTTRLLSASTRRAMYPDVVPYKTGNLKIPDSIHTLYYELSGNPDGSPVVFLHGGPGGGCVYDSGHQDASFFNPKKYNIILHDQRGSGKSTPTASLEENTTWDLVKDIERLREHLGIQKWHVFGGSWGSTLSLAYAQSHPDRVRSLILRGIFTLRKRFLISSTPDEAPTNRSTYSELDFFYQNGTSHLFPEAWDEYISIIPEPERHDMLTAYHAQLNAVDDETRITAAKAWTKWEMATSRLYVDPEYLARADGDDFANAFARIENHYFVNDGFMRDGQLLEPQEIDKIRHIPCIVVQGRYDVVCPATTAYQLKKAWPEITLHIVPDAGHSTREKGIEELLIKATDQFADLEM
ncbi:Proline iminopeptidase [Mycena indigotica]|uniref:prolyl aminopeptidase n=1 Tax=Mycena indigotica TaxID=2126181 RepID=A0A8H6T8X7_9AGAR|nr:Proline iminopeptidase [Mycena indigotica]KAF7312386.1 Proline iminopeptidase [Mycena indigotica]